MKHASKKKQRGAETLEFIIVFPMFLAFVLMVFDFGRAMYVWNTLTEATRRGARMAVVCPTDAAGQTIVRNVAAFGTPTDSVDTSPVVYGLTPAAFDIQYYNEAGASEANPDEISFAEVSLNGDYEFEFIFTRLFGFFGITIDPIVTPPEFRATLYAESLGRVPTYPDEPEQDPRPRCDF